MKRLATIVVGTGLAVAVSGLAAAEPIISGTGINIAAVPDPRAVERCGGPAGPAMVWNKGSLVPSALPRDVVAPGSAGTATAEPKKPVVSGSSIGQPGARLWSGRISAAAAADGAWCGGAYRPDAGSNFGS